MLIAIRTGNEQNTRELGRKLASSLRVGDVIGLDGELGTGKTQLAAGVCRGLGVTGEVTSPTFSLIHEYAGRLPVAHLDAYRVRDADEFLSLGVSELWEEAVVLVEWASKVRDALPADTLFVTGRELAGGQREWTLAVPDAWTAREADFRHLVTSAETGQV